MKRIVNCIVVDDEPLAVKLLTKHISQFSQLNLVGTAWNALEAFKQLESESIDLVFLDIQMPEISGIDFVKSLKNPPSIIFTTAYRDYAVESYELDVVDYLLKPITLNRFLKSINKYFEKAQTQPTPGLEEKDDSKATTNDFIYVNSNRKYVKIAFNEVLLIESMKDYIKIETAKQQIQTKEKISEFEKSLPSYFLRVHRSFIVNIRKITAFTTHDIEIENREIPIGISYKQQVMKILKEG